VRAVVGIGEAGPEIVAAFPGLPASLASSMDDAVIAARRLAEPGDVVVLSPGCASFDWYRNYGERGDDFTRSVHEKVL
jgi:UDP-N-acetylmuramoylalanine--D-glutamate ligase